MLSRKRVRAQSRLHGESVFQEQDAVERDD